MPIDVAATIAGLDVLKERINAATEKAVEDSLHLFQLSGMETAPMGREGNTTNAPGDLARSILVDGPRGADGTYEGAVGPTEVYGRQRELGGDIYPKRAKFLHFFTTGAPGSYAEATFGGGMEVFTKHVFQFGAHYMLRAYEDSHDRVETVVFRDFADAILEAD